MAKPRPPGIAPTKRRSRGHPAPTRVHSLSTIRRAGRPRRCRSPQTTRPPSRPDRTGRLRPRIWRGSNRACAGCNARGRRRGSRVPRSLASVPGLRPVNLDGPPLRDPQFIDGYRVPPSLTPERLPQPPRKGEARDHLRGSLRILLASVLAAPIAYYVSVGLPGHSGPSGGPELASSKSRPALLTTMQVPKGPVRVAALETADHAALPAAAASACFRRARRRRLRPARQRPLRLPWLMLAPAQTPPGSAIAAVASRAVKTVREVDPDTVRLLMQQGAQFVAAAIWSRRGSCSSAPRRPVTQPPHWRWGRPMIRSYSPSSGARHWRRCREGAHLVPEGRSVRLDRSAAPDRAAGQSLSMIPKKACPREGGGGRRFSEKIMLQQKVRRDDVSKKRQLGKRSIRRYFWPGGSISPAACCTIGLGAA